MGGAELAFLLVSILIDILMMPLAATGKGTAGLIRGALGDLEMARREYDRDKGTAHFSVELTGRVSLCASATCDWHASHVKILHGEPIETSSRSIQGATLSAEAIRDALRPLEATGEV